MEELGGRLIAKGGLLLDVAAGTEVGAETVSGVIGALPGLAEGRTGISSSSN